MAAVILPDNIARAAELKDSLRTLDEVRAKLRRVRQKLNALVVPLAGGTNDYTRVEEALGLKPTEGVVVIDTLASLSGFDNPQLDSLFAMVQ